MKLLNNYYTHLLLVFTTGILLMVGWIFYLLFGPYEIPTASSILTTDPVKAGQLVRYEAKDCKTTSQEATISRIIKSVDKATEISIGIGSSAVRVFQCSNIVLIPQEAPTGDYRLVIVGTFQVNPIRSVTKEFESQTFHVNNPDPNFVVPDAVMTPSVSQPIVTPKSSSSTSTSTTPTSNTSATPAPAPAPTPTPTPPPASPIEQVLTTINDTVKKILPVVPRPLP